MSFEIIIATVAGALSILKDRWTMSRMAFCLFRIQLKVKYKHLQFLWWKAQCEQSQKKDQIGSGCIEPILNFLRKYFWAYKIMLIYCNRNISSRLTLFKEGNPHGNLTAFPAAQEHSNAHAAGQERATKWLLPDGWGHASHRGLWETMRVSAVARLLWLHPGAPDSICFCFLESPRWLLCSVLPESTLLLKDSISKLAQQEVFSALLARRNIKPLTWHHLLQGRCYFRNSSGKKTSSSKSVSNT